MCVIFIFFFCFFFCVFFFQAEDGIRDLVRSRGLGDVYKRQVVGQQPFGGARASGTNDKAGSALNLYRWLSARTIKETFVAATDYRYPFLLEK